VAEVLVAVGLAHLALGESLTPVQWFGGLLLAAALLASGLDRSPPRRAHGRGWLYWLRPPVQAWPLAPTVSVGQPASPPHGAAAEDFAEPKAS
jgi:hypothetical protein